MSAAIGDIREVNVIYAGPSGSYQTTHGFVCVTAVAGDDLANLGAAFQTAMIKNSSGGLLFSLSSALSSNHLLVKDVRPGTAATYERVYTSVAGAGVGDMVPPQASVVFTLRTALRGRSFRGRFYLPGLVEGDQAAGNLTAGAITNMGTIGTQLLAVFGPSGTNGDWRLAVISRFTNGAARPLPIATQVTSIAVNTVLYTQRRRVAGVGT